MRRERTMTIEVLDTGLIFRGAESHDHLRNAAFPSIVARPGGTLVVTMAIGREQSSADVRCYRCVSTDGGASWSGPRKIFEPDTSDHPVSAGIRMSRAHDGTLIGFVNLLHRRNPEVPATNRETGGTVERDHAIVRSTDGEEWSELEFFHFPLDWKCFGEPSPVLALSADRWLLPSLTRLDWEGYCPLGLKSFVMISGDRGKSWPRAVDVFDLWSEGIVTWEQKQARLTDGRIFAVTWAFDGKTKKNLPNLYTFSEDEGDSYLPPFQSPLHGQTCTPLPLPGNRILCIYRRLDRNGLWAHLAEVRGTDWIPVSEACLWGSDRTALAGGRDSSIQHQHTLQFGFPQVVQLEDGTAFVVFWGIEDKLSLIRWFRLKLP
jgi:hypothetical protein